VLPLSKWTTMQADVLKRFPRLHMLVRVEAQERKGNELVVTAMRILCSVDSDDSNSPLEQKVRDTWIPTAGSWRLRSTEVLEDKSTVPGPGATSGQGPSADQTANPDTARAQAPLPVAEGHEHTATERQRDLDAEARADAQRKAKALHAKKTEEDDRRKAEIVRLTVRLETEKGFVDQLETELKLATRQSEAEKEAVDDAQDKFDEGSRRKETAQEIYDQQQNAVNSATTDLERAVQQVVLNGYARDLERANDELRRLTRTLNSRKSELGAAKRAEDVRQRAVERAQQVVKETEDQIARLEEVTRN
jgi:hypothetical protein